MPGFKPSASYEDLLAAGDGSHRPGLDVSAIKRSNCSFEKTTFCGYVLPIATCDLTHRVCRLAEHEVSIHVAAIASAFQKLDN